MIALLTSDDVAGTRFSSARFRPGYRPADVDDFVMRVLDTLDVIENGGSVPDPVTPEEAASVTFPRTTMSSGYEIAEVDEFVAEVVATLASAEPVSPGPPDTDEGERTRLSTGDVVALLRDMVVGQAPDERPAKSPKARRVAGRNVQVDAAGVHWRTWTGRSGTVPAGDVAAVMLLDVAYASSRGPDLIRPYALVLDRSGAARLRVGQGLSWRQWRTTAHVKARLKELWAPLGVPVTRWAHPMGRAKDARLRWPEAFSFVHAYPNWTGLLVLGVSCGLAAVVDQLMPRA